MFLRVAALSLIAGVAGMTMSTAAMAAAAADPEDNVCLVTFSAAGHAANHDVLFVAAASVMPRVTAQKIVNDYSVIYNYPDLDQTVRGCQCLSNPAPANNLPQRQQSLLACPKPTNPTN